LRESEQDLPIWKRMDPEGAIEIETILKKMLAEEQ
jgi:hypothetical protein